MGFVGALGEMVAMVASAAASLTRVTPLCNGSIQGKRVMQSLMALQAAKLFVAVESGSRGALMTAAAAAPRAKTTAEVAAFCPLYSSLSEVSTRRFVARSAAAANGGEFLEGLPYHYAQLGFLFTSGGTSHT